MSKGLTPSPWKKAGVSINKVLGSSRAATTKKSGYPNEQFNTIDEYADFAKEHGVFGNEAYKLKKEMGKRLPLPILRPKKGTYEKE